MSEGNSIYDGPNMGDESELDSWADHTEPNEDEAPELLPVMPLQLTWPG